MADEKRDAKNNVIGVAWYRREHWPRLLDISADWSELEDFYDDWLEYIEQKLKTLRNEGLDPVKVDVDPEELLAWCASQKLPVDGKARAQCVTEKVQKICSHPRMVRMAQIQEASVSSPV